MQRHPTRFVVVVAAVAAGPFSGDAPAQQPIERVSVNLDGTAGDFCDSSGPNPISADGRYVAFASSSSTLVANDVNNRIDVFVRDRLDGKNVLVSVASNGTQGDSTSFQPAISGDGRYVAFASSASNLVAHDTNNQRDLFLHDRDPDGNGIFDEGNGTTIRISRKTSGGQSDAPATRPAIARDGSLVVFDCQSDLTPDSGAGYDVFGYDVKSGTLECLSVGPGGVPDDSDSIGASVSADGRWVAFESWSSKLVSGDTKGFKDVFVRDRTNDVTTRVSVASDGSEADGNSFEAAISGDGNAVAFTSEADNLVGSSDPNWDEVFVHEIATGATTLVSVLPDGTFAGGDSSRSAINDDGAVIAFMTTGVHLIPVDKNGAFDIVLADRAAGTIEPVSTDCIGFAADAVSQLPAITPDGRFVSFLGFASNYTGDGLKRDAIYLRDRTIPWPEASRTTYGAGWPGTHGIPSLTADVDPEYGATIGVTLGNSWGRWSVGFLFVGSAKASLPTSKGGTLLVEITALVPVALSPSGALLTTDIPFDEAICGLELDLQGIEQDPGASRGVSFSPGLELIVGR